MSVITGDCVEVMAGMEPESVDAVVTDPPYGLEFMGKEWDRLDGAGFHAPKDEGRTFTNASGHMYDNLKSLPRYGPATAMQEWHQRWATGTLRVAKPGAYLLAFGGTRTVHRLTVALEDAGWIIRDLLVWAYAQGFPKSRSSLKPAWEPIVLARKPGPLRELAIDACRLPTSDEVSNHARSAEAAVSKGIYGSSAAQDTHQTNGHALGRWPANVILTDPIFDGGWEGVVGGGEVASSDKSTRSRAFGMMNDDGWRPSDDGKVIGYGDTGTYSRFFVVPKASRADREPLNRVKHRRNTHPTVKPVELMRHLVRLVTPQGGTVLDPFAGSGSTLIAAEREGFHWIGIEREAEYVAIAQQRLVAEQRGMGLSA